MTVDAAPRFQVGGAVRGGALYVRRSADEELVRRLLAGEVCAVLAPRQIGKSSLRVHTARVLESVGVRCATVDLTTLGVSRVTPDAWLDGLRAAICDRLDVDETEPTAATPIASWLEGVRSAVAEVGGPVALLIDEIDALRSLPFAPDDLLGALRAIVDAQATDPVWAQVRLALFGVAAPGDLASDPIRTPFDLGFRVALDDFTPQQAIDLLPGLAVPQPEATLTAILGWTDGHPSMTAALCAAAVETPSADVDTLALRRLLGRGAGLDASLGSIANAVLNAGDETPALLSLYRRVLELDGVESDRQDPVQQRLMLTGIVARRLVDGAERLRVRNRAVATLFDRAWLAHHQGQRQLTERAWAWVRGGRRDDDLLRGEALREATAWAEGRTDLGVEESGLLLASAAAVTRAALQRRVLGLGVVLATVVLFAGIGAFLSNQAAQRARVLEVANAAPRLAGVPGQTTAAIAEALRAFTWATPGRQAAATEGLVRTLESVRGPLWSPGCGQLRAAAWSTDTSALAVACHDGSVRVLDPTTGLTTSTLYGPSEPTQDVAWADPGVLLSGGADGTLRRWDLRTGAGVLHLGHSRDRAPGMLPGIWRVIVGGERSLTLASDAPRLWRLADLGRADAAPIALQTGPLVIAAAFAPDGRIATAASGGEVALWTPDGDPVARWALDVELTDLAWSPDGVEVVVVGARSALLRAGGAPRWLPEGEHVAVTWGDQIAAARPDGPVDLWDGETGQARSVLFGPTQFATDLAFTDGGMLLAAGDDDAVRAWRPPDALWASVTHIGTPWRVVPTPDGERVATPAKDGSVAVLHTVAPGAIQARVMPGRGAIGALQPGPDGQLAVATTSPSGEKRAWLTDWALSAPTALPDGDAFAWLPDGRLAVSLDTGTRVVDQGRVLTPQLPGSVGERTSADAAHGDRLVTVDEQRVRLWSLPDLRLVAELNDHTDHVFVASLSPDGSRLFTGDAAGRGALWSAVDGAPIAHLDHGADDWIFGATWSDDGGTLVTTSFDNTARVWDGYTGAPRLGLEHDGNVVQALFLPNDRLATLSRNRVVRLWDLTTGAPGPELRGHTALLREMAVSTDGARLASVADDGTLRLWDAQTGEAIATWTAAQGIVRVVSFDRRSGAVLTGGDDGVLRAFPADTPHIIGLACSWLGAGPKPAVCD